MDWDTFYRHSAFNVQTNQRVGQAMMNALYHADPEVHDYITESRPDLDPFYDDMKTGALLTFLQSR